eukprot:TRINITY_DN10483_c0_g2_i4.p2 TRINITY_DN10483_c0_g2~~TRINITY_DN10483_c0_g2_i4.p2  ORF type:complete len:161 (+),score=14.90 TRINITY_DN10483_c0_g2_i4:773-1255(+)
MANPSYFVTMTIAAMLYAVALGENMVKCSNFCTDICPAVDDCIEDCKRSCVVSSLDWRASSFVYFAHQGCCSLSNFNFTWTPHVVNASCVCSNSISISSSGGHGVVIAAVVVGLLVFGVAAAYVIQRRKSGGYMRTSLHGGPEQFHVVQGAHGQDVPRVL